MLLRTAQADGPHISAKIEEYAITPLGCWALLLGASAGLFFQVNCRIMTFYINVPVSELGTVEKAGEMRRVDSRAHATEMFYGDAAYLLGIAQEKWAELAWRTEHARTRKFLVVGETKDRKQQPARPVK